MGKKHYPQSIKDEAVLFYELGHSFTETQAKYGMAESTFFTWKQKFDKAHPMHEAITTNRTTCHKSKRHLEKKFNCFLSLWAIAASIPDTLPL